MLRLNIFLKNIFQEYFILPMNLVSVQKTDSNTELQLIKQKFFIYSNFLYLKIIFLFHVRMVQYGVHFLFIPSLSILYYLAFSLLPEWFQRMYNYCILVLT